MECCCISHREYAGQHGMWRLITIADENGNIITTFCDGCEIHGTPSDGAIILGVLGEKKSD